MRKKYLLPQELVEQPSPTKQTESTSELLFQIVMKTLIPSEELERTNPVVTTTVGKETRAQDLASNAPSSKQHVSDKWIQTKSERHKQTGIECPKKASDCDIECSHCHKVFKNIQSLPYKALEAARSDDENTESLDSIECSYTTGNV